MSRETNTALVRLSISRDQMKHHLLSYCRLSSTVLEACVSPRQQVAVSGETETRGGGILSEAIMAVDYQSQSFAGFLIKSVIQN